MLKGKERMDMQNSTQVDEEDLYTLKVNCKGKRTVGKANKGINIEKISGVKKTKKCKL